MAPGKKRKKGSKKQPGVNKGIRNAGTNNREHEFTPVVVGLSSTCTKDWVTLEMHLLDWRYMNYSRTVPTDTELSVVRSMLKKRHGWVCDLVMYKHSYSEKNELTDDSKLLKEYVDGGPRESAPALKLFYDFKTADSSSPDPILLC